MIAIETKTRALFVIIILFSVIMLSLQLTGAYDLSTALP